MVADMLYNPTQIVVTIAHMQSRHHAMVIDTAYLAQTVEAQELQDHHFWVFHNGVMLKGLPRIATLTHSSYT